ncbi:Helix-turn-helix domain protein [Streptomyces sp. IB2014 011-1]|nr:Helix-turn-helix domain protein [Streptomyces sp. IB2014 011-1]
MIRAYKFLMRPTARQEQALGEMLRDHCSLYNGALQERRDAYRHVSKTSVKYGVQSAQLKDIRAFDPESVRAAGRSPHSRRRCAVWTRRCKRSSAESSPVTHQAIRAFAG